MKTYILKNIITGEIKGKCTTATLAGAQEYFDIMFPYLTGSWMLFETEA